MAGRAFDMMSHGDDRHCPPPDDGASRAAAPSRISAKIAPPTAPAPASSPPRPRGCAACRAGTAAPAARGDLGDEPLDDFLQVVERVAPLHPLRHPRQQVAHRPVGVALGLQPLPFEAVFAEDADRLRHIADLVDMADLGRLGSIILHRQPVDDIAELYHRMEHALLEDEIEDAEDEQRRQRQRDLGYALPQVATSRLRRSPALRSGCRAGPGTAGPRARRARAAVHIRRRTISGARRRGRHSRTTKAPFPARHAACRRGGPPS